MTKRYIPRWLYTEATVLANWIKIPPGTLRNDTIWPMQLEYLVVAGAAVTDAASTVEGYAGIGDLILAELGMSQEGDINTVPAMLNGVFSCGEPARLQCFITHETMCCHFRHPYRLSRDNGFTVRRRNRVDLYDPTAVALAKNRIGIVFRGVDIVTGKPVILGGNNENRPSLAVSEVTFDSADLMNRGMHDVDIYSVCMDSWEHPDVANGVGESYLINPILGERWMPGETEVPTGCIAPYGTMGIMNTLGALGPWGGLDARDIGPHTFVFPPDTYLHRRQEVALRLSRSFYALNQPVQVALFGYLEVE